MLTAALRTVLVALLAAGSAAADAVSYEVEDSVIHRADRGARTKPDGNTYYAGGPLLYSVTGRITGERDLASGSVAFTGGSLVAVSFGRTGSKLGFDLSRDLVIDVTGGGLTRAGNGRPQGFLHTRWEQGGAPSRDVTFYFAPYWFTSGFNTADNDWLAFNVWGNNTVDFANGAPASYDHRIGIDLTASGGPIGVREPAIALLLLATGLLLLRRTRRNCE